MTIKLLFSAVTFAGLSLAAAASYANATTQGETGAAVARPKMISTDAQKCFTKATGAEITEVVLDPYSHPEMDTLKKTFNKCITAFPALEQTKLNELKAASTNTSCFQDKVTVLVKLPTHIVSVRETEEIFHKCELISALKSE